MEPNVRIELFAERGGDLASLCAIRDALQQRGETPVLSVASGVEARGACVGPVRSRVRLAVGGTGRRSDWSGADRGVALLDSLAEPLSTAIDSEGAERVLVPGAAYADLGGAVDVCGLPRLDVAFTNYDRARARARERLGLAVTGRALLFAPTAVWMNLNPHLEADRWTSLARAGAAILVCVRDWPEAIDTLYGEFAASRCGIARIRGGDLHDALIAADACVSDSFDLLCEAMALGARAARLGLEPHPDLPSHPSVSSVRELPEWLAGSSSLDVPDPEELSRFVAHRGAAAERVADVLIRMAVDDARVVLAPSAQSAEEQTPRAAPSELDQIDALVAFGDEQAARERLESLAAIAPAPEVHRRLASLCRKAGDTAAAEAALVAAESAAVAELARVHCERGRIRVDLGDLDAAATCFERASELDPESADALVGRGSLALQSGDAAAAERLFQTALQREKSSRTWTGLGLAYLGRSDAARAFEPLEAALDAEPDGLSAIYGIVQAAFQTGELARAERRVARFCELHTANLDVSFTLAGLRAELGDKSGALELLDRIELFDADYAGLAELRRKLGG